MNYLEQLFDKYWMKCWEKAPYLMGGLILAPFALVAIGAMAFVWMMDPIAAFLPTLMMATAIVLAIRQVLSEQ